MPSNYPQIECVLDNGDGTVTELAGATVKMYNVTGASALPDLTADGSGIVPAGTLAVAVGTEIRVTVITATGITAFDEFLTT